MVEASADGALVDRARGGDSSAFREIVECHQGAVAATVIGMLGHGEEAEDVGQETFIRFYKSMHRFRGDSALRTYLTRIAMNSSLNALKRRKRRAARVLRISDETPDLGASDRAAAVGRPDDEIEQRDRERAVRAAIDALDEKHRAVVALRMIEGLSTRETSEALGVPEGTVLSRLSRALKKLEADLAAWIETDD